MTDIIEVSQQGAPGPVGLSVANAAALSAAPTNTYLAGTLAFIQPPSPSVPGSYYSLSPTSTATPDGVTVIAAANGGNWLLFGAIGTVGVVGVPIGTSASYASANTIPANALITGVYVRASTAYSGGTIRVFGNVTVFASDLPPTADTYGSAEVVPWGGTSTTVSVTIGGAPSSGAGTVLVSYVVPAS